ncbi:hypothetical protein Cgig2_029396 [Carnegiea gigantea]|uniref:Small ribosomal subunit protein uS10 domain-containing protein n=1 Tax=Carnegiea gigantea TaxID=171969 RepID=A0A9Q1KUP1_9CARY|nr:hypothetical protein Cgig2_029396 [Carnegiea gigantea]
MAAPVLAREPPPVATSLPPPPFRCRRCSVSCFESKPSCADLRASLYSFGTAMSTKIHIVVSSFGRPVVESFPAYTRKVGLPESRVLYTVLRSPHIDKKSREQFEMRIQKHVLDIKAERHELHHKLFWLKRHRMLGAQFEVQVSCKTRLDPKLLPLRQNHLHSRNLEQYVNSGPQDKSS